MHLSRGHLIRGTLQVSASRAVEGIVGLTFSVVVARTLGEDYGYIGAAMGVWGILNILSTLGVPTANTRHVAELYARGDNEGARASIARTMLLEAILTGVASVILMLLAGTLARDVFHKSGLEGPLRVVAPMLLVAGLGGVWLSTFQGLHRYRAFATVISLNPVVRLTSAMAFLAMGMGVEGALLGFLVGHVVALLAGTALGALLIMGELPSRGKGHAAGDATVRPSGGDARGAPGYGRLLSFGAAVSVGNVAIVVFEWADKLMLAAWRPISDVAVYTVAFGMVAMPLVLPRSVNIAFLPLVSTLESRGEGEALSAAVRQVMRLIVMAMAFVTFAMMALAPWLVGLLYGEAFKGAVAPFMVLALWGLIRPVGLLATSIPQGMGRPMAGAWALVGTMCLNIALNSALIPLYGLMGAAVGTTVSYVLGYAYLTRLAFSMVGAGFPWGGVARSLVAASGGAAAALALRLLVPSVTATSPAGVILPFILLAGLLGLGVYLLLLGLLRAVREEDVGFVTTMGIVGSQHLGRLVGALVRLRPRVGSGGDRG